MFKVRFACLKYDLLLYFRQEHGKIQKKRQTLNAVNFDPRQPKDKTVNQGSLDGWQIQTFRLKSRRGGGLTTKSYVKSKLYDNY
jgi:hypothetical protein